jgi:hypothetical protein
MLYLRDMDHQFLYSKPHHFQISNEKLTLKITLFK